jgi:hypothetical protein
LQDALTQAVQSMARFAKPEPKAGDLMVSKDFGISGNRFDLQFLTQLCLGGKISQETMWEELQRRGTLVGLVRPGSRGGARRRGGAGTRRRTGQGDEPLELN